MAEVHVHAKAERNSAGFVLKFVKCLTPAFELKPALYRCSVSFCFLLPVAVPRSRPSVPGHSQAVVCRQKNERQIMTETLSDVNDTEQWELSKVCRETNTSQHTLVYMSF